MCCKNKSECNFQVLSCWYFCYHISYVFFQLNSSGSTIYHLDYNSNIKQYVPNKILWIWIVSRTWFCVFNVANLLFIQSYNGNGELNFWIISKWYAGRKWNGSIAKVKFDDKFSFFLKLNKVQEKIIFKLLVYWSIGGAIDCLSARNTFFLLDTIVGSFSMWLWVFWT